LTLQPKVVAQNVKLTLYLYVDVKAIYFLHDTKLLVPISSKFLNLLGNFSFLQLKLEPPPKCEIRIEFQTQIWNS
jgi:hypothetical protein